MLILVFAGLYLTGWHTEVLGTLQRGVIATGLIRPDLGETEGRTMDYDFRLTTLEGQEIHMSNFRQETLFINLWATWCPPCIAEMPDIHDLYLEKGEKVEFLMISLDDDPKKAAAFIDRKGFEFPVYIASYGLPGTLRSNSIPTTYVVAPNGQIKMTRKGLAKYDTDEFKKYLDNLVSK